MHKDQTNGVTIIFALPPANIRHRSGTVKKVGRCDDFGVKLMIEAATEYLNI